MSIHDGRCEVARGFAERADVRYTADARGWCSVALGALDARDAVKQGLMTKDGGSEALDHYFSQVSTLGRGVSGAGHGARPDRRKRS